jgi:hypothetical protein
MKRLMYVFILILFSVAEKNPIGATPNLDISDSHPESVTEPNNAPLISNGSTKQQDLVKVIRLEFRFIESLHNTAN